MGRPSNEILNARRAESWTLWVKGSSYLQIATTLGIPVDSAWRDVQAVQADLARLKSREPQLELIAMLTSSGLADLAESHRISNLCEKSPTDKYGVDFRSLAMERAVRTNIRKEIARINGLDKGEAPNDNLGAVAAAFEAAAGAWATQLQAPGQPALEVVDCPPDSK